MSHAEVGVLSALRELNYFRHPYMQPKGAALVYWSLCAEGAQRKARIEIGSESEWGKCEEQKLSSCREQGGGGLSRGMSSIRHLLV